MKTKTYRSLLLASSIILTVNATAQNNNDSIVSDTTMWYNQTQELGEIIIKSTLPKIRTNADGMKVIITGSELEKVGNSEDLLKRLPSVKSVDDGIEIFGRGNAEIYVNGRKLYDMKEFKEIPSDQIANVEIITNPGARYSATTKAVVKIKTKRPQGEGWGFRDELKGYHQNGLSVRNQLDVNYRKGGLDLGGWSMVEQANRLETPYQQIDAYQNGKLLRQSVNRSHQDLDYKHFDLGLKFNYIFNENHSIGARYDFYRMPEMEGDVKFPSVFTYDGRLLQNSNSHMITNSLQSNHNFNAYYSGKLGQWQVDANLDGFFTHKDTHNNTDEVISMPGKDDLSEHIFTSTLTKNSLLAGKLVLERPLLGGKISFGTEYDNTRRTEVTTNPKASDGDIKVNEQIWSGFAEYSRMFWEKLTMKAGLRYENVNSDFFDHGKLDITRDYADWFPSLGLSMSVGQVQMGAHYGIDIARPSFENLSENVYYINSYSYQTGNSKLKPTYTHNISLNASWKWLWMEAAYNRVVDDIQHSSISYSKDNELITLIHPDNLNSYHRYTFQAFASPTLYKVWHPTWGVVLNGQDYKTITADGSTRKMNSPIFTGIWNNLVMLKSGWRLGLDFQYQSVGDYSTYHLSKASFVINSSIQKSFFNDKLDAKFMVNDITGNKRSPLTLYSNRNLYVKNSNPTYYELTLIYKFNVASDKYKGQGAGDKVKSRM